MTLSQILSKPLAFAALAAVGVLLAGQPATAQIITDETVLDSDTMLNRMDGQDALLVPVPPLQPTPGTTTTTTVVTPTPGTGGGGGGGGGGATADTNTTTTNTVVTTTPSTPLVTPTPSNVGVFNPNIPTELQIQLRIQFALNSSDLLPEATPQLQELCTALSLRPALRLNIFGHTDSSGGTEFNQTLSQQRAESVRNYLTTTCGIDAQRLFPVGLGEEMLLQGLEPTSPSHRRVEFQVVA